MHSGGASLYHALPALGPRIAILGPSCSGKSTLARAIGHKMDLPVVHLDWLRHLPDTDWQIRPDDEFKHLHDEAIQAERWVMDGNYSILTPQRLERATGAILLADNRWANLARYFKRTLWQRNRAGHLPGAPERVKWMMIHWIMNASPQKVIRYRSQIEAAGLPLVHSRSIHELQQLYRHWQLTL